MAHQDLRRSYRRVRFKQKQQGGLFDLYDVWGFHSIISIPWNNLNSLVVWTSAGHYSESFNSRESSVVANAEETLGPSRGLIGE